MKEEGRGRGLKSKDDQDRPSNLDRADHFGPFHGSNRRRGSKRMITLDLNHFGFQRAGEKEE